MSDQYDGGFIVPVEIADKVLADIQNGVRTWKSDRILEFDIDLVSDELVNIKWKESKQIPRHDLP